eukprot:1830666-Amphidinium_carterae.1
MRVGLQKSTCRRRDQAHQKSAYDFAVGCEDLKRQHLSVDLLCKQQAHSESFSPNARCIIDFVSPAPFGIEPLHAPSKALSALERDTWIL